MDNPILYQIVLALVALFFIFVTYMNTKTWRWLHVTIMFLLFVAIIPFGVYAGLVMKTRMTWITMVDKLEKELGDAQRAGELATYGDPKDVEGNTESIVDLRGKVGRVLHDRGRVWRGMSVAQAAGDRFTLNTVPPQDPALPAAPVGKHNLTPGSVVFAFKEGLNAEGITVPLYYLGEFVVTAATDTTLSLESALPMGQDQIRVAADPNPAPGSVPGAAPTAATWVLYEILPMDGAEWFAGLDEAKLRELMPQAAIGLPPAEYEKFIAEFVRDGSQADEVNDPPENIWFEVKFDQPHEILVDATVEPSLDLEPFAIDGRAQHPRLRRAAPGQPDENVKFEPGQTAVFDKETADFLVQSGKATKVRPIFRRTLVDFDTQFHRIWTRWYEVASTIRSLSQDVAAAQAMKAKADEQYALVDAYRTKLAADKEKLVNERDEVAKYRDSLANRLAEVQTDLSQLYKSNKALSRELAAINARLTEEIDARTNAATAMNR
ncbi:MAG: hypothetical protein MUF06_05155 [Pirellulaceae bacterium]|jgi:energy-coupling factor transporter transmembrane protein EcfT|nr:hypothetical protein [Pirellulaceae bacterium]